jgi:hypothetical protein
MDLIPDQLHPPAQGMQEGKRLFRIPAMFDDESSQVLFGFGISGLRDKERLILGVRLDHITYAPSQDSPYENIGVS